MTAAVADRNTRSKIVTVGGMKAYPVATNTVIWKGTIVAVNAAGFIVPATDTAGLFVVGVAHERGNNNPGANGDVWIRVEFGRHFSFNATGTINQALLGKTVTVSDDNTVADAATTVNDIPVGDVSEYVSATELWVYIAGTRAVAA